MKWTIISGSAEPRVQSTQGPGAGDDNDIGQSLCSNGRHIPPTAQGPVITKHCTDYGQPEVILCWDTGVLTLLSKRVMWWLDIFVKEVFFLQCN